MHVNAGHPRQALPLLRRFADAFRGYDAIVCPSGSCAAMVRHGYPQLVGRLGDPALAEEVLGLCDRVHELSELLVDVLAVEDVGAYFPHRVTYHPSCHALRGSRWRPAAAAAAQRARAGAPRARRGDVVLRLRWDLLHQERRDVGGDVTDKLAAIAGTGAEVCVSADSSCLMHIGGGLSRGRHATRTLHLAEVLAATEAGA